MKNELPKVYKSKKIAQKKTFWAIFLAYLHTTLYTIE